MPAHSPTPGDSSSTGIDVAGRGNKCVASDLLICVGIKCNPRSGGFVGEPEAKRYISVRYRRDLITTNIRLEQLVLARAPKS
jgi:hypothetical protein